MPKEPKTATKTINKLHKLVDLLRFYMYSQDNAHLFRKEVIDPAQEVEDYILEISAEKKADHIRLIQRWEARQKRLKDSQSET